MDVAVVDIRARASDQRDGRCINAQEGASVVAERAALLRCSAIGLHASGTQTSLDLTDVTVVDTVSQTADGRFGRAMNVQDGAVATWTRGAALGNRQVAIFVHGLGSAATLTDMVVRGTKAQECGRDCADQAGGTAICVVGGATVAIQRFEVTDNALAGLQLVLEGTFQAVDGLITGNMIGLNIQDPSLDVAAAFDRVVLRDNNRDRDFNEIPAPSAAETLDTLRSLD